MKINWHTYSELPHFTAYLPLNEDFIHTFASNFSDMKFQFILALFISTGFLAAQPANLETSSPDGQVKAWLTLSANGEPSYKISFGGREVVASSPLGLQLRNHDMTKGLSAAGNRTFTRSETWKPVWGEVDQIADQCNGIVLELRDASGLRMDIVMRVYDDGVGIRYEFPENDKSRSLIALDEITAFNLTEDLQAWWVPSDWDSNEHTYKNTRLSQVDATSYLGDIEPFNQKIKNVRAMLTPVTMQSDNGYCISIADAAVQDYGAMHLEQGKNPAHLRARVIPGADDRVIAAGKMPFNTPWRAILLEKDPAGILSNRLILNLNEPCKIEGDLSWIKPQKYVGIWWEMHIGKSTWYYTDKNTGKPVPNHGANTANVKKYIDFAAKNGFSGVLVEGWNTGWEEWFNSGKEEIFDFSKPYPDYDMDEISRYAKEKNVKIIVHHETSAAVPSYVRQMPAAYDYMKKHGFDAIKTGYVGYVIPKGQWHDGQYMVNHYNDVLRETAKRQIMVVAHEPTCPSGLHRTWPNFMAAEAARGQEYNAWSKGNDPSHELTLIFTRWLGGPMDYTPGIFQLELNQFDPNKKERVRTTLAKQLALYVTLYSPVQMAADLPENYEKRPAEFQFIRDVPTDWSDTRILNAAVGDYVTIARRKKNASDWFIGSMTDEQSRSFKVKLDFLEKGRVYEAVIYEDGPDAHYLNNPYPVNIRKVKVRKGDKLTINLAAGGGFAAKLTPKK